MCFIILTGDNLGVKEEKSDAIHKKAKRTGKKQDFIDYI